MLLQTPTQQFKVPRKRKFTHEEFTKRYALANLETNLLKQRLVLEVLPETGIQRRRQREKIWRIEQRIDILRLEIAAYA